MTEDDSPAQRSRLAPSAPEDRTSSVAADSEPTPFDPAAETPEAETPETETPEAANHAADWAAPVRVTEPFEAARRLDAVDLENRRRIARLASDLEDADAMVREARESAREARQSAAEFEADLKTARKENEKLAGRAKRFSVAVEEAQQRVAALEAEIADYRARRRAWFFSVMQAFDRRERALRRKQETLARRLESVEAVAHERAGKLKTLRTSLAEAEALARAKGAWARRLKAQLAEAKALAGAKSAWAQRLKTQLAETEELARVKGAWARRLRDQLAAEKARRQGFGAILAAPFRIARTRRADPSDSGASADG